MTGVTRCYMYVLGHSYNASDLLTSMQQVGCLPTPLGPEASRIASYLIDRGADINEPMHNGR